ncbi:protein kinase [Bacilli bacterium]|nr:protein kinase [Bacilli bacterium]
MLDDNALKEISNAFIGDSEGWFNYKKGPELVTFFNQYFDTRETYGQGFPSRWVYVHDHLVGLINSNQIDKFFNIILSKEYALSEFKISEVEAVAKIQDIFQNFNSLLRPYGFMLSSRNNKYHLTSIDEDLKFIGSGGFANVYLQKSTGYIMKKLKDDFLVDTGIKSRFKREYKITESLQDVPMIIKVIDFDEGTYSYRMEEAETTLEKFISENQLDISSKVTIISQIMYVLAEVHSRNIMHRDLSPTNIFIVGGMIKIADFGLGKDLNIFSSHQTITTTAVGQYWYCAPEQFMLLKDGDKRSDVYSLGRIINFIMTGSPQNTAHQFRSVTEKATNENSIYRYADASEMIYHIERSIKYHADTARLELIFEKIQNGEFDDDIESYIYELPKEKMCETLMNNRTEGFSEALLKFMRLDDKHAQHVIQSIESGYVEATKGIFTAFDPFASFADDVLVAQPPFSFTINEIAAKILRYVAKDVNRFNAQRKVDNLLTQGLEPMIEEILEN